MQELSILYRGVSASLYLCLDFGCDNKASIDLIHCCSGVIAILLFMLLFAIFSAAVWLVLATSCCEL